MPAPPQISVVVATHNRADRLDALLASLRRQDVPPESFEVVVVDDGSSDRTAELLDRECRAGALALKVVRHRTPAGPGAARNSGWRQASGEIVGFTDDDCVVADDWIAQAMAVARAEPGCAFQGCTEPIEEELPQGPFGYTQRISAAGPWYETCNIFYPRAVLEELGGFDAETFPRWGGEDTDLGWRALEHGTPILYAPQCRVRHAVVQLGPVGRLRRAWRFAELVALVPRHPGLVDHLPHRRFWTARHWRMFRALVALLLPRRLGFTLLGWWLAAPYVLEAQRSGARNAPYVVIHDVVEVLAIARGGMRHRTLVL